MARQRTLDCFQRCQNCGIRFHRRRESTEGRLRFCRMYDERLLQFGRFPNQPFSAFGFGQFIDFRMKGPELRLKTKYRDQLLINTKQSFALTPYDVELPHKQPVPDRHQQNDQDKAPAQPAAYEPASNRPRCLCGSHCGILFEAMISDNCFCSEASAASASALCSSTECNACTYAAVTAEYFAPATVEGRATKRAPSTPPVSCWWM